MLYSKNRAAATVEQAAVTTTVTFAVTEYCPVSQLLARDILVASL